MTLRAWGPLALPRAVAVGGVTLEAAPAVTEQQKQEAFAQQLVLRTGLTLQYAILCLTETGWDLEKAFVAFEANRVSFHFYLVFQWPITNDF
jgi:nuclear RNA export factor